MDSRHIERMKWLAIILIASVLVIPAIAPGDTTEESWKNTIFDFQPLFGGLFAIVAAYLTIVEMRHSEEKSQKRHQEILLLTLREEYRRKERALDPGADFFRTELAKLKEIDRIISANNVLSEDIYASLWPHREKLVDIYKRLYAGFTFPPFKDGTELFSGRDIDLTQRCETLVTGFLDECQRLFANTPIKENQYGFVLQTEKTERGRRTIADTVDVLVILVDRFQRILDEARRVLALDIELR